MVTFDLQSLHFYLFTLSLALALALALMLEGWVLVNISAHIIDSQIWLVRISTCSLTVTWESDYTHTRWPDVSNYTDLFFSVFNLLNLCLLHPSPASMVGWCYGEGESRGNQLTKVHLEGWPLTSYPRRLGWLAWVGRSSPSVWTHGLFVCLSVCLSAV